MFENMKLGVARATALAAAHAVINEKALGVFISECEISEYSLKTGALAGNGCYPIVGRTNTGKSFSVSVIILRKKDPGDDFPIEKAIVAMDNPFIIGNRPKIIYFECTFPKGHISIRIRELEKSPHEIVEEPKSSESKQEENLLL